MESDEGPKAVGSADPDHEGCTGRRPLLRALAFTATADRDRFHRGSDPERLDFRLCSLALPAIDHGGVLPGDPVPKDYHGELRDTKPDIGADEWQPTLRDLMSIMQSMVGTEDASKLVPDIDGAAKRGLVEAIFPGG